MSLPGFESRTAPRQHVDQYTIDANGNSSVKNIFKIVGKASVDKLKNTLRFGSGRSQITLAVFTVSSSGEIHLTPLKGVIQLRPNFEYLDRSKERKPSNADEGLCLSVVLGPKF